jgi:drug/metabolite transporter (DMT)-like permease
LNPLRNHISLHLVVFIWGFTGILGKLISIPSDAIVLHRMLIAGGCLWLYLLYKKRRFRLESKLIFRWFLIGCLVAAHWATFFQALKVSTVSVVLCTLASASLWSALLEPLVYKRRIIPYELILGLLVVVGLLMIFNFETGYRLGILLSLISAFLAALFTVLNGKEVRSHGATVITFWEMLGGAVGILFFSVIFGTFNFQNMLPNFTDTLYLLLLGIVCTAVAFVVSVNVMKVLTPFTVSMSINMEPIYSIMLALLIFGEEEYMSPGFYTGAVLIFTTVVANGIIKSGIGRKWITSLLGK